MSDNKVVLITGAGRGIGRAVSLRLAREGYDIAGTWTRDEAAADALTAEVEAAGGRAVFYRADVSEAADVQALHEGVLADFGRLDALISNGGIGSRGNTVAATELREVHRVVGVHAIGAFHLCSLFVPVLRESDSAAIVLISSIITTRPMLGGAPYHMGKAALEALATTLAMEEAEQGIRVNVVAPGLTVTDMGDRLARAATGAQGAAALDAGTPFGRITRPEDIADAVWFLVSPAARQITGQRIEVHGGKLEL